MAETSSDPASSEGHSIVDWGPGTTVVLRWSKRYRAKLFGTGFLMIAPGVLLWVAGTNELSFRAALQGLLVPQLFAGMALLPIWGCARIAMAFSPGRQQLLLDDEGCTIKVGSRKTRINWNDVTSISAVEATVRRRFVFPGISGAGPVGAAIADPKTYDSSISTASTGRGAGIELCLRPGRYTGRASYWIADEFEEPRNVIASLMNKCRERSNSTRLLNPGESPPRGMNELNDLANYNVVYAVLGGTLWMILGGFYAVVQKPLERNPERPPVIIGKVTPGETTLEQPSVRLNLTMPVQP